MLRWGSNFSEARSRHHDFAEHFHRWRQWRSVDRLVFIDDMMDALGATEGVEGDRGNYRHARLHAEFGCFNTTWEVYAPDGLGKYAGGSGAFSFHWRSIVNRVAWRELGVSLSLVCCELVCQDGDYIGIEY